MNRKLFFALGVLVCIVLFVLGLLAGMLFGTYAVIDHIANGLAGSSFTINFNETKMVEELNRTVVPQMLEYASRSANG